MLITALSLPIRILDCKTNKRSEIKRFQTSKNQYALIPTLGRGFSFGYFRLLRIGKPDVFLMFLSTVSGSPKKYTQFVLSARGRILVGHAVYDFTRSYRHAIRSLSNFGSVCMVPQYSHTATDCPGCTSSVPPHILHFKIDICIVLLSIQKNIV